MPHQIEEAVAVRGEENVAHHIALLHHIALGAAKHDKVAALQLQSVVGVGARQLAVSVLHPDAALHEEQLAGFADERCQVFCPAWTLILL